MAINEINVDVNRYLKLSDEWNGVQHKEKESELDL